MALHVLPADEAETHDLTGSCRCEPVSGLQEQEDGTERLVVQHNSASPASPGNVFHY